MQYGRINSVTGEIEVLYRRPRAFLDSGEQVDDAWLIKNDNTYPIVDDEVDDKGYAKPAHIDHWKIESDKIVRTFYAIVDNEPKYDPFLETLQLNPRDRWVVEGEKIYKTYQVKKPTLDELKITKLDQLALLRYQKEVGGATLAGFDLFTDRQSQSRIGDFYNVIANDETIKDLEWKTRDGFKKITRAQFLTIHKELFFFIKACYETESLITKRINESKTLKEMKDKTEELFETAWPSNALS